jgi:hypothetical protein
MTKLKVRPIDPKAPGSWKKRRKLLAVTRDVKKAVESKDEVAIIDGIEALEALIIGNLYTDDGSSVEEALELLSVAEWEQLSADYGAEEAVPTTSSEI